LSQLPPDQANLTKAQAIKALWYKGVLHWKLDANQIQMRDLIHKTNQSIAVIGASRQIGKSFAMCVIAVETCLKSPNTVVKYIAPKVKDVRKIIAPLIREICSDAPTDLVPKYRSNDHIFRFANGSEIQLAGTDNGHAESIRGTKSHLCIVDEAGFCDGLNYIVNSILLPTTTTTKGKIVMISTPPKSLDHDFVHFMGKAQIAKAFLKKTIYDNPRLQPEDIQRLADAVGGVESPDFRREYMVQMITDANDAVIPEFNKELQSKIIKEWKRPPYFDSYEGMDIGFRDQTAVVFGYYDFRSDKLIIEDELAFGGHQMLTDTLAKEIHRKETELWSTPGGGAKPVFLRIADDNNPILLNDLSSKHQLTFLKANKDDADAALNNLRLLLKNEKVIINPRCVGLIHELENTIWNKNRTSYTRAGGSHGDLLDALKYLCRHINKTKNPYPDGYDIDFGDRDVFVAEQSKPTTLDRQLQQIFTLKPRRFVRR
jgi:hypothetical protein